MVALGHGAFAAGLQFLVLGWPIRSRVYRENWRADERRATVRVTSEGVFVDGRLAHATSLVADGYIVARAGGRGVRLLDARRRILSEIDVASEEEATSILSAVGIEASRRRARFDTAIPPREARVFPLALVGGLALLGVGAVAWWFLLPHFARIMPLLFFAGAMLFLAPLTVRGALEIGADGLLIRWMWTRRFVSFDEIRGVERTATGVKLQLGDGDDLVVNLAGTPADIALKHDGAMDRIRVALAAHRRQTTSRDLAARLARRGRPLAAWRHDVTTIRDGEAGYRQGAVRADDLWLVLEDASAPEDARAAAAMLLRDGGEDARARLRVAAETTVSPRLRVALDAAAGDGATATLDDALADFDETPAKKAVL